MMRNRTIAAVLLCALAAALAGCASPRTSFYTLTPLAKPAGEAAGYSVSVGPVSVPELVDRPQIAVRAGAGQVAFDEFNRWGAPLQGEIARVVAADLSAMLGTPYVSVYPVQAGPGARYRVVIDVTAFESEPGGSAALDAIWSVRPAEGGAPRSGRTAAREPAGEKSYPALVAAHSRTLEKLSGEIADAIREMERQRR